MSSIALSINNRVIHVESKDMPVTSDSTIKEFQNMQPGLQFPCCKNDYGMHESSLHIAVVQLEKLGSNLGVFQQVVLSVMAIAGVILCGVGAVAALGAATPQAALLFGVGLPLALICSYVLNKDDKRDECKKHVERLFGETMQFYLTKRNALAQKLSKIVDTIEAPLLDKYKADKDKARDDLIDPTNNFFAKVSALQELKRNAAYFAQFELVRT